jgi:hypothetical protein
MKPHHVPEFGSKTYQSGILDNGRMAVLEELGKYIPEVSVDDFIRDYLPPNDIDIDGIVKMLQRDDHITKEGMWSSFPNDPADNSKIEPIVFKHFKGILNTITEYVAKAAEGLIILTLEFVDNPSKAPFSERGNLTRPDGYSLLKNQKSVRVPKNTKKPRNPSGRPMRWHRLMQRRK